MVSAGKYFYRIKLDSVLDVFEFVKTAVRFQGELTLVNGKHRLNAKSAMGVALARVSWDEMNLESDSDCYFDFEKFII